MWLSGEFERLTQHRRREEARSSRRIRARLWPREWCDRGASKERSDCAPLAVQSLFVARLRDKLRDGRHLRDECGVHRIVTNARYPMPFPFEVTVMQNGNEVLPQQLIQQLNLLRSEMLQLEASGLADSAGVHPDHRPSAANLVHYLALRRHDIRELQAQLASLGLSSLGRTESHVIGGLHAVMKVLNQLAGSTDACLDLPDGAPAIGDGDALLERNSQVLLGPEPSGRSVRIMVTMPSEAATDYDLVRDLVLHGMDCMRINCAHDGPEAWSAMVRNLRRAVKETARPCKISMDLAGPKLRTGPIERGPAVLKFRPQRDDFGRVVSPARIWLTPLAQPEHAPAKTDATIPVPGEWLAQSKTGDRVRFTDSRGANRSLTITGGDGNSRWAECTRTSYIVPGLALELHPRAGRRIAKSSRLTSVGAIAPK